MRVSSEKVERTLWHILPELDYAIEHATEEQAAVLRFIHRQVGQILEVEFNADL